MFLSLDGTAIVQLVNFAIFFAILNVVFLRPVSAAIKRRRAYIDSVQADYDANSQAVRSLHQEADARKTAARRDAEEEVAAARAAAEREAARLSVEFGESAATIAQRARDTVEGELNAAGARGDELAKGLADSLLARALESKR